MTFQQKAKAFEISIDPKANTKDVLDDVIHDCALAFNCRAIESEDENYSTGCTYFIRGNETPKTGLEELAQQIFRLHSRGKTFNPALSGAEWWTQVIDERDDIGVHWDRDYGMEEEMGTHIYPHYATVTYFAEKGSPTVIWDKEGTIDHSFEFVGECKAMEFSRPQLLKHIAFPGNLLHAAPSVIMFGDEDAEDDEEDDEEEETTSEDEAERKGVPGPIGSSPPALRKREDVDEDGDSLDSKRITFLVNIWFNHIPSQSVRCGEELFPKFKTAAKNLFHLEPSPLTASPRPVFPILDTDCTRKVVLKFVSNDIKYDVSMPLPSTQRLWEILDKDPMAGFQYSGDCSMQITYSSDQGESEDEEEDEEEEEEEEEEEGNEEEEDEDEVMPEVVKRGRISNNVEENKKSLGASKRACDEAGRCDPTKKSKFE